MFLSNTGLEKFFLLMLKSFGKRKRGKVLKEYKEIVTST